MFDRKIKVYVARAMTGRIKEEVVREARYDRLCLEACGFEVLCPVSEEAVKPTKAKVKATKKQMDIYWKRDKQMIREAHVIFNMSPHMPSLGVIREHGYARYHLWKKVISIFPKGKLPSKGAIPFYEDDFVTDELYEGIREAQRTHGTYWKRLKWRLGIYNRAWLRAKGYRLLEWFR